MPTELLTEIAGWKLEAKLEDNQRYFYHTADVDLLNNGSRSYVIGRKGTGKTAIREFLYQLNAPDRFSEKLTFKNFPFNDLYRYANARYTPPNQYITLWKGLIYVHIAKLMIENHNIKASVRQMLEEAFPKDPTSVLSRSMSRLTDPELKLSFAGMSLTASAKRAPASDATWIERCDVLETLIASYIDDATYTIVFDELDEDYRDVTSADRLQDYIALITGLFKAVQDIRANFPAPRFQIHPIIFLRDDIYEVLTDSDKTKWDDLKLDLTWDLDAIRNLLRFRISRALNPTGPILDISAAVTEVFRDTRVKGEARGGSPTEFIAARTLGRPRDYISFFRICAERALARRSPFVDGGILRMSAEPFSTYLRSDIQDEIQGTLPEIRNIIDVIARMRKAHFSLELFEKEYQAAMEEGRIPPRPIKYVADILFDFSVIGNFTQMGRVFRFKNPGARFNPNETICILRGLLDTLHIADPSIGHSLPPSSR